MATARITRKGQTTIPKEIREKLKLRPGDRIEFVMQADGSVTMRPITFDVRELYGMLKKPAQRAVSLEEMEAAIIEGASESMR